MDANRVLFFAILFHTFFDLGFCMKHGGFIGSFLEGRESLGERLKKGFLRDAIYPPEIPEMLIFSSPMERKISYVQLKDFKAEGGVVLPILDSGLISPYGLAWDGPRSALYICDGSLKKIFRVELKIFKCTQQCKGIPYHIKTTGNRFAVVEGVIAQWATVDHHGNLYFTDQETKSVNKLPVTAIDMIIKEKLFPKQLLRTNEAEAAGEESAQESVGLAAGIFGEKSSTKPTQAPSIYQFYENGVCPHVGTPSGLAVDGSQLYWANQVGGFGSGSVVAGKTNPHAKRPTGVEEIPAFPSHKVTDATGSAYGVAVTSNKIMFTDASHSVWGTSRGTGQTVVMSASFSQPRGIVWDGDNTVYIADQLDNRIVSMPVGMLKERSPVSHTVDISGPFGVALIGRTDPVWEPIFGGAYKSASRHSLVEFVASVSLVMIAGQITSHV